MARLRTRVERAAVLHRQAAAAIAATASAVDGYSPSSAPAEQYAEQHELAARLRSAAADLIPGWLGSGLDAVSAATPAGGTGVPAFLRLGMAHPLDDAAFPAIAPLFGTGHLAIDADARDHRVAGLLRSVLLRLVAAAIPGALHIRVIDAAGEGDTIAAFAGLPYLSPPITDHAGMQSVLIEADQWIRNTPPPGAGPPFGTTPSGDGASTHPSPANNPVPTGSPPTATNPETASSPYPTPQSGNGSSAEQATGSPGVPPPDRYFVLVIASLPELTDGNDLARIAHLARIGVAHRLHLVVAGWPPPPLTAETTQAPLPHSTQVSLRNPYVWVGDPPGATYSGSGVGPARLNAPVYLDPEPPADVIRRVCAELAAQEPGSVEPPTWAPSAQRWSDYVRAAQRLDAVRRQAAKVVTEQTAAVKRVRAELATARRQVAIQQNRIGDMVRDGQPVPLRPTATDLSAADAALGRLAQAASQRAAAAQAALTTSTGGYPIVTGSIPTGGMINPGGNTGGFPVVAPRPGPAPQPPNTSGWAQQGQPAAYSRGPSTGPVQVTSPPRPGSPGQQVPGSPGQYPPANSGQNAPGSPGHHPAGSPGQLPPGSPGQYPPANSGQQPAGSPAGAGPHPQSSNPGQASPAGPAQHPPGSPWQYPPTRRPSPRPTGKPPAPGGYAPVSGPGQSPPHPGHPPVSGPGQSRPVSGPVHPPVSGPGYPPVSGPGGRPPVSGPGHGQPPVSGPGHGQPPVSGPAGRPPVSGLGPPVSSVPHPVHVNTGSFPTVHSGAFPVVSAPPGTGVRPPAGAVQAPAVSGPAVPGPAVPGPAAPVVPAGPPSANPRLPEAAMTMIAEARATLQRADAELSDIDARIKRSPGARNGLIYFSYAVLFALAQVPLLFILILGDGPTPLAVVPCGVVMIFLSFALAWLTIGFAYREPSGQRPRRTPALGLMISLIAGTPAFVSAFWAVLFS